MYAALYSYNHAKTTLFAATADFCCTVGVVKITLYPLSGITAPYWIYFPLGAFFLHENLPTTQNTWIMNEEIPA